MVTARNLSQDSRSPCPKYETTVPTAKPQFSTEDLIRKGQPKSVERHQC
jgi:hypothetical protein